MNIRYPIYEGVYRILTLKKGCEAIGIQLLDHIILTEDTYLSYMDEGML